MSRKIKLYNIFSKIEFGAKKAKREQNLNRGNNINNVWDDGKKDSPVTFVIISIINAQCKNVNDSPGRLPANITIIRIRFSVPAKQLETIIIIHT